MDKEIPKHSIGDIVYYKLDKDQNPMFLISIWIRQNNVSYECKNYLGITNYFQDFELSVEQNILTKIT